MRTGSYEEEDPDNPGQMLSRDYTFGLCAARCHGAVAAKRGGKAECNTAGTLNDPLMFEESTHTGCLACCDVRFSEGLRYYHLNANAWNLPMDDLSYATPEGILSGSNPYGVDKGTYQIPSYYWPSGSPPTSADEYWPAFYQMAEDMLTFWGKINEIEGGIWRWQGLTCPHATPGLEQYADEAASGDYCG